MTMGFDPDMPSPDGVLDCVECPDGPPPDEWIDRIYPSEDDADVEVDSEVDPVDTTEEE